VCDFFALSITCLRPITETNIYISQLMMKFTGLQAFRATPQVLDEEKSKHAKFGSAKWFWPSILAEETDAEERHSQT
jgi:hypothetical protein